MQSSPANRHDAIALRFNGTCFDSVYTYKRGGGGGVHGHNSMHADRRGLVLNVPLALALSLQLALALAAHRLAPHAGEGIQY